MAFRRKTITASAAMDRKPTSLIASAIRTNYDDLSFNLWKFRDEGWQRELWRFYDIIPEFGFAARWVGQCCSRVRIYVAEVDKYQRVQGEVKDPKINALADTLLGGPATKAELLRALGINLTVSGECYIVGRPGSPSNGNVKPRDQWYVLSSTEMRRVQGSNGQWQWAWVFPDGNQYTLDLEHNVITRVWTPHPSRVWCADSPARSCQMVLRELEQLTKYVFSQIDSRLVGAGLLIIPNDLDLPQEQNATSSSDSLMIRLATAGAASLRGEGSALGVLPHIVESANPDGWKLLSFDSQLSNQAMELRKEAVNRLGVGLDMPPEVLTGLGESNHWCVDTETEIYTQKDGWMRHDQIKGGETVLTLNHYTGRSEWLPVEAVNVFDVVDEPVLSMESDEHSSITTRQHYWPVVEEGVRTWIQSENGFLASTSISLAAGLDGLDVPIAVNGPVAISDLMYKYVIGDAATSVSVVAPSPQDRMQAYQIYGKPEPLQDIERRAIELGLVIRWSNENLRVASYDQQPVPVLTVYGTGAREFKPVDSAPTWTTYTGQVWCPTTKNMSWFARRNGKTFFTGNSGFLIDGYGIKVHIEPLMNRICAALTTAYLDPALRLMGKDPERYTYTFDTSPLVLRPQRLQDALNLYEKGMLSAEAVRGAGYFKESEAPTVEEDVERFLREMMMRDGQLLQNEAIRLAAGIPEDIVSQEDMIAAMPMDPAMLGMDPAMMDPAMLGQTPPPGQEGGGPPPPPAPPTGIQSELPPPIPTTLGQQPRFAGPPTGIQASAAKTVTPQQMEEIAIAVIAEATVRRGLEIAGKRLLDRDTRNQFRDVPTHELHTRIKVEDQARVNRLLNGAWDQLDSLTQFVAPSFDTTDLRKSLERYCGLLLLSSTRHDPHQLLMQLRMDGVISVS